jgi:hypothetical protein
VPNALGAVQRGLEQLYRLQTGVRVEDYVVDEDVRSALSPVRRPREQLLVSEHGGELSLALFVDAQAVNNLSGHDGFVCGRHLDDFLLALEGVSHFVYTVVCAQRDRQVSALELELQAEVDKYVTCLLQSEANVAASEYWQRRLFVDCQYDEDLDVEEQQRYRVANDNALRYCEFLHRAFVVPRRIPDMLRELRHYYRRGLAEKLTRS